MWSLGCVLYEMTALHPPFNADNMDNLFKQIMKGAVQRIPKWYSDELWLIVKYLLQVDPKRRPNCEALMKTPSFRKK